MNEPVVLSRDCDAVHIPSGETGELQSGTLCTITQSLGGSFTVAAGGNLFRIDGKDADALGKQPPEPLTVPDNASDADIESLVLTQLGTCYDPEIPVNIVDLGLIYDCRIEPLAEGGRKVAIQMTLTAPGCGMGDILVEDVRSKVLTIPTVKEVDVEMVFEPPWSYERMSDAARLQTGLM